MAGIEAGKGEGMRERFFLISYSWQNGMQYGTGNLWFSSEGFPSSKWIKGQCAEKKPFAATDVVIAGIYEFANAADFDAFCADA